MSVVRIENACLAYGARPLLEQVSFVIEAGQRYCLLGRNGEGKSSFLKVIQGDVLLDDGSLTKDSAIRVSTLPQTLPEANDKTVYELVGEGLGELGAWLAEYQTLIEQSHHDGFGDAELLRMQNVQEKIESRDGWRFQSRIETMLQRFGLDATARMHSLSGGWRRRVLLAQALIGEPDVLLLDEPTNHLDLLAIEWLENRLSEFNGALVFVSHDRAFIKKIASRILELDRGKMSVFAGDYEQYLVEKQKLLEDEARQNALFDKRLSEEEVWIRQGIKARRTRNEGRVRALKALRKERSDRLGPQGSASIQIEEADKSGKIVAQLEHVRQSYGGRVIIDDLNLTVQRGDRIGLIGPNGAGKTTLLKILLGQLQPDAGNVKLGTKVQVAYFDQLREGLNMDKTVMENVADGHDFVELGGKSRHVMSYLNDFLFTSQRARSPVRALSGGETNRLLLARLFAQPSNVIVMDEPTNDLDVDTLELLEERLNEFSGTLLLTSHDRDFIDNVVTSTLVFEGAGRVREYVGGYSDWVKLTGGLKSLNNDLGFNKSVEKIAVETKVVESKPVENKAVAPAAADVSAPDKKRKLSYKLQRELELLPEKLAQLEAKVAALHQQMGSADFYAQGHAAITAVTEQLTAAELELEQTMTRWLELEDEAG